MRWVTLVLGGLSCLVACGGTVAKSNSNAAAAGAGTTPNAATTEVIDDVDHAGSNYPSLPPGSSGFFWRGGLGNWFVTTAEGSSRDAPIDETVTSSGETGKAYHASGDGRSAGVELWAQLNHPDGRPVDLSAYSGISFKTRQTSVFSVFVVAFNANGQFFGGAAADAPEDTFDTSEAWQTRSLSFKEMKTLDPSAVTSIDFVIASGDSPFELWVDDLTLLCQGPCPNR